MRRRLTPVDAVRPWALAQAAFPFALFPKTGTTKTA